MSNLFRTILGRWWICLILLLGPLLIFPLLVQPAADAVVAHGRGAPKILDEYVMTWTPAIARNFYESIGPDGRTAYQQYYWHFDFWFPVLSLTLFYISLLSIALPARSRFAKLNLLPILMWMMDAGENLNHFSMARAFPNLSEFSLTVGPWFTFIKWALIFAIPVIAILGFAGTRVSSSRK